MVLNGDLAVIYFGIDDYDKVYYHLKSSVERHASPINVFLEYPLFRELKKDPRFLELKKNSLS